MQKSNRASKKKKKKQISTIFGITKINSILKYLNVKLLL